MGTGSTATRSIHREPFGTTKNGEDVDRFTLINRGGTTARIIELGATLTELWVRDRQGRLGDVVLGFERLSAYEQPGPYFGATIGRVANRTAGARFTLDGVTHVLEANDGASHLHGGSRGFDKAVWAAHAEDDDEGPSVTFSYSSPDRDSGYPGNLSVHVTYRLGHDDTLRLEYTAETDAPTPVNLTNHTYWNLAGGGDVLAHELRIEAELYTEVDVDGVPTGRLLPVAGSAFDFTSPRPIGRGGKPGAVDYDHNFVLAEGRRAAPAPAAELYDPSSGRRMTLSTTEPGVQLYCGNFLDGVEGKRGGLHPRHGGVCLEAQQFPDALHHDQFPSIVLRPGETYRQVTAHRFTCARDD